MGAKITPPNRSQEIVTPRRTGDSRVLQYFEAVSRAIEGLPDEMAAISDLSLTTPTANELAVESKINEILAALRSSGRLGT